MSQWQMVRIKDGGPDRMMDILEDASFLSFLRLLLFFPLFLLILPLAAPSRLESVWLPEDDTEEGNTQSSEE